MGMRENKQELMMIKLKICKFMLEIPVKECNLIIVIKKKPFKGNRFLFMFLKLFIKITLLCSIF